MLLLIKKLGGWSKQQFSWLWESNSGDWPWLAEKTMQVSGLNRSLWRGAVPSISFYVLLSLSGVIATFGLLANSAATIIGAMIVAPLMGPIIAIAYSMVAANQRLLKRSTFTLIKGILLTVAISFLIAKGVGIRTLGSEIAGRISPTLLDMGVALAAGAAGAYAKSRRSIADALPGVAIAVALVPPLSVVGIGLAMNSYSVAIGSSLLFLANLTGIIFSGAIVFLSQGYGSLIKARQGLTVSIIAVILLGLPLSFSLQTLLVQEQARRQISYLLYNKTQTFADTKIRSIKVRREGKQLFVDMEVAAALGSITDKQMQEVHEFLQAKLNRPINFQVQIIPTQRYELPASKL
ncbi:DUF389 domain-containing protein [Rivularia sp. UHCC 0363]|uniref:DUF389 domain-containing protein n=1 Tax=Rivularia sp. UHCC 0363 TaxID=3110244 RepID=UPI002B21594F|nr:DUF389 domain-containing protein [Rivularia sp. UHCC 0363]MEA5596490.1 DUF389 domain-containing protein [Rivularia sp. UHCC 0363]